MISSMASSSSATVRVEKATSEFLIGPDWTLNMEICDIVNSNQMLAKDVVKAVKKRLQHKNPKVQLLALTLLETIVKNCGDYVHFQIAEKNILPEMVKIVKKKTDMHVRDKVLTLIGSWHEAFGGSGGRYPQYYMAYEDLRRFGVQFPRRSPDAAPIFTPPATHAALTPPPGYGMPSSSSTRLDEAMAADDTLSLSSLNSMRDVLELLTDMLQAVDPSDRSAVSDEIIVDLVEQCRVNQRKLMQLLGTTGDEEVLVKGLELNDSLQCVLAKHDAIASGSPQPPELTPTQSAASEKHKPDLRSSEVSTPPAVSNETPPAPAFPAHSVIDEEEDEEDDFAQLARRHSKAHSDVSQNSSTSKADVLSQEAPSSPTMSNALVPIDMPTSVETKDQSIIELLSIVLSTGTSNEQPSPPNHMPSSTSPGTTFSPEAYPANNGFAFNNYVAPWAQPQQQQPPQSQLQHPSDPRSPQQPQLHPYRQPQPQPYGQPQPSYNSQSPVYPQPQQVQPQYQQQYQYTNQPSPSPSPSLSLQPQPQPQNSQYAYPPPPWAATPGYFSSHNPMSRPTYTYSTPRPAAPSNNGAAARYDFTNREAQAANSSPRLGAGQKPFIPSYRLFEDLDVFSSGDGRFRPTSNASPSLSGPTSQNMVGGRK